MQKKGEAAIDYFRRIARWIDYETESYLQELPTIQSIIDFFELWAAYKTDLMVGVIECLFNGDDPKPYNDFIKKYNLPWRPFVDGEFVGE
jgi:hypothetical protein